MSAVMIVDDHPMVRDGLEAMLEAADYEICGSAADGEEAIALFRKGVRPDVVIMDIRMPGKNGFETLQEMKIHQPDVRVLMMAGMPLKEELERARTLGARGYISKTTKRKSLVEAIERILSSSRIFIEDHEATPQPDSPLTPRETEVLKWLSQGKSREETAIILGCSLETVKSHARSILFKLGVQNTAGAVTRAFELGLLRA